MGVVEKACEKDMASQRLFRGDSVRRNAGGVLQKDSRDHASLVDNSICILDRVVGILVRQGHREESRKHPGHHSAGHMGSSLDRASTHHCSVRAGPRLACKLK